MPADRHGLLPAELHEAGDDVDRFLTVAVGELVVHDIERVLLPLALFVLTVPHFHTIEVGLADVVQEAADGDGLLLLGIEVICFSLHTAHDTLVDIHGPQPFIDVDAVLHQPARAGQVEAGAGRGREEVCGLQPLQELLGTGPGDILTVDFQELFFHSSFSPSKIFLTARS